MVDTRDLLEEREDLKATILADFNEVFPQYGTETLSNNQVVVTFENAIVFESYGTLIAIKKDDKLYVTDYYDYSRTTSKYLNQFCGRTSKEITKELENKNPNIVLLKP